MLQIHLKTKDYLPQAWLYPSTDMAQFHGTLFGFHPTALSQFSHFPPQISNFFDVSSIEET
jgi:hypothetical protein